MDGRRLAAQAAGILVTLALLDGAGPWPVSGQERAGGESRTLRIEARFVDPASGREAPWGATGQIMIPPLPADPAIERWRQERTVASSPSRQSLALEPGAAGLIRVGREIPFAGWFLRHGARCGWIEAKTEWREVESALEIEAAFPDASGAVRLSLTPEFSYLHGRARRTVAFPGERVEVVLQPGAEARLAPLASREGFYRRLLAGYDPLRRVWPVELVLRVDAAEPPAP
jgi:hypothetical protein